MKPLITIILCLVFLSACKKNTTTKISDSINGKWTHTKILLYDANGNVIETTNLTDPKDYVQFNSNGTGITSDNQSGSQETTNFSYKISSTILIVNDANESDTTTIKILTSNSLVLHEVFIDNINGNQSTDDFYTK